MKKPDLFPKSVIIAYIGKWFFICSSNLTSRTLQIKQSILKINHKRKTFLVMLAFYLPVAVSGFLVYGMKTENNIIDNLDDNWIKTTILGK
jgi:hypothetical protein